MLHRYCPILIALLVLPSTGLAEPRHIPFRLDQHGSVVVPVEIDGQGPFPFLLDTGASRSVISDRLATRLGLDFVARTEVLTTTGREVRPVVRLTGTTIGTAVSGELLASVAASAHLRAVAHAIEGIIGQDFLGALNYTLDYRRRRLIWIGDSAAAAGTRLPLVEREGRYLVQIPLPASDPILLVPDSGSNALVLYERHGRTRLPIESAGAPADLHSLSGGQAVRLTRLHQLQLGRLTLTNQTVAIVRRDTAGDAEGDGLLPLHYFRSVTFNGRERSITIED